MFKLVVMIFAIHGGVAEPLKMLGSNHDFADEVACTAFMKSKEGQQSQHRFEKKLATIKVGAKLKAKFACIKTEEKKEGKSEDDGSI